MVLALQVFTIESEYKTSTYEIIINNEKWIKLSMNYVVQAIQRTGDSFRKKGIKVKIKRYI